MQTEFKIRSNKWQTMLKQKYTIIKNKLNERTEEMFFKEIKRFKVMPWK